MRHFTANSSSPPSSISMKCLQGALALLLLLLAPHRFCATVTVIDSGVYTQVASSDFNGDGNSDVAISFFEDRLLKVYFANGISFTKTFEISTGSVKPRGISVADINGDGKPDIILCNAKSSKVLVYYKTTGGTKHFAKSYTVNTSGGANCHDTTPIE